MLEQTFRSGAKVGRPDLEQKNMQYLYQEGDQFVFMDNQSYEQIPIDIEDIGDAIVYLKEGMDIEMLLSEKGEVMGIDLPTTVIQEITEAEPNVKGNTASGSGKKAVTETGLAVIVPFFVEVGDKIKIDTRNGNYIERA
ncbi:MAG: elongation factor P [Candidatus Cloacimonetes bacterium]|nr:elongation factor P [Candidatus Cloacimonadota bacterium]